MTITAHGPATYQDLLKLPENVVGEILDGELYASPRPGPRHLNAESELLMRIRADRGGPDGWWILAESELHMHADVLVSDIGGWKRARMPQLPKTAWFEFTPDWICEVLSPSTGRIDRSKKLRIYARERVPFAWLVDPLQETVEVMKLSGDLWEIVHVFGGHEQMSAPPFEELTNDLRAVWGENS